MEINLLPEPHLFQYYGLVLFLSVFFAFTFFVKALKPIQKYVGLILLLVPPAYFYWILDVHMLDVPYIDDYDLLESIFNITSDISFLEKIKALFSQINQHRFAYERIVMWLILVINGAESIKLQIVIGNLLLLGIFYLFFQTLKREGFSWYFTIPISFLLFNLVYYENAFWGIAALQNTSLLFFALWSAYALGLNTKIGWYLALATALLASFTSGSGLITWFIGASILIVQRQYRKVGIWSLLALATFLFYFLFDYKVIDSAAENPLNHPVYNLLFLLEFWGNVLYLDKPHPNISGNYYDLAACVALGLFIGIVFCGWLVKTLKTSRVSKSASFMTGAFMFTMGTGAMLVLSRPIAFYVTYGGELLSRRYMIFGVVLVITAYTALLILFKNFKKMDVTIGVGALLFALGLNFFSYFTSINGLRKQHDTLALDGHYWRNYEMMMSFGDRFGEKLFWNHPTRMTNLIYNLEKKGIYALPKTNLPVVSKQIPGIIAPAENFVGHFESTTTKRYNYWLDKETNFIDLHYARPGGSSFQALYFQLKSPSHLFILPASPVPNEWRQFLSERSYYGDQHHYSFFANKFLPDEYEVWIVGKRGINNGNGWESQFTGKRVKL